MREKWDIEVREDSRQEYKEMQHMAKREVTMVNGRCMMSCMKCWKLRNEKKICIKGEKDVQQVRVIKDRD